MTLSFQHNVFWKLLFIDIYLSYEVLELSNYSVKNIQVVGVVGHPVGECLDVGPFFCGPTSIHLSTGRLTTPMTLWSLK